MRKAVVLQTCLPDYRLPLFERLMASLPGARLICGRDYFTPSLALCTEEAPWRTYLENRFSFSRAFLWQPGVYALTKEAEVVIAEFNPRILSTWVLLLRRRVNGKRTLLWGHLWGQHGPVWLSRHLRLFMLWLSDGMISYSHRQAEEFIQLLPGYSVWAAANSCVTRAQCEATEAPRGGGCITYVGRLIKGKKPGLLLEGFARALDRLPAGTKLLLVGDGSEWNGLRQRVKELGLSGRVEMPGHIASDAELRNIYGRSEVAVSSGYVGLSAIQCMAFGVPMVVSRNEPHSPEIEACVEGKTCVFFATDDVDDLAEKLVGFFRPDSPWRAKRPKISEFIARNYTFDGMVEAFAAAAGVVEHEEPSTKLAFAWAQFGPYHLARLRALRDKFGAEKILGVEIASKTLTYAWQRDSANVEGLGTLIPGATAERTSAVAIYQAALRVFQQQGVSIVFVPSYWPASSLAVLLAARTAGARVVMMNDSHAHTAKARGIWAEMKRRLVLQFDAALVAGGPQRDYFSSLGMVPEKIVLGYDAVDNDFFIKAAAQARMQADALRAKHGLPKRYFLNVGRMVWKKNLETLVDAYREVRKRIGEACPRLVFVGSGRLEKNLQERCLAAGLSFFKSGDAGSASRHSDADVFFLGFRQAEELPDFYALASAFILPSREEEWGLVVNEAMASGLPVLVSRVAGCAQDLVRDGENGFLFDPFDVNALAGYLERIARQPGLSAIMGAESQRIIAGWGCDRFARAAYEAAEIALQKA
jgi:glycosyltransferase involved in cell wall biosynthesis